MGIELHDTLQENTHFILVPEVSWNQFCAWLVILFLSHLFTYRRYRKCIFYNKRRKLFYHDLKSHLIRCGIIKALIIHRSVISCFTRNTQRNDSSDS